MTSAPGLYVHFPYCAHHCAYCDFAVATPRAIPAGAYTDAVLAELRLRLPAREAPFRTVYLGGGTPSLWPPADLGRFLAAVQASPGVAPGAESTLEANPDDVTPDRLAALRELGIDRLSLGVQSFRDPMLRALDRRHDAEAARLAARAVSRAGFRTWSLDLMLGLPGQTLADLREDLEVALAFEPPHLSVYALTVEPRTFLARDVARGRVVLPGDDVEAEMLLVAREVLGRAGFVHYEVSSFARPGHRAVHNSGYWEMRPYLGLGAGAHGFLPPRRYANHRRPARYVREALEGRDPAAESADLSPETLAFERLMTGLRDLERGVDLGDGFPRFAAAARAESERGRLEVDGTRLRLTERGLLVMDDVLLSFVGP